MNGQAGDDAVKTAVYPGRQPGAEIRRQKANAAVAWGGLQIAAQFLEGLFVLGRAVQPDDLIHLTFALFPQRLGQLAAAAPQVQPTVARPGLEPGRRIRQQMFVRGHLMLAPKSAAQADWGQ